MLVQLLLHSLSPRVVHVMKTLDRQSDGVGHARNKLLVTFTFLQTSSVALLIATKAATRAFCDFCILESCVLTC